MKKFTIEIKKEGRLEWILPDKISKILNELPDYAREELLENVEHLLKAVMLLIIGSLYSPAHAIFIFPRAFEKIGKACEEGLEIMRMPEEEFKELLEKEIKRSEELEKKK